MPLERKIIIVYVVSSKKSGLLCHPHRRRTYDTVYVVLTLDFCVFIRIDVWCITFCIGKRVPRSML